VLIDGRPLEHGFVRVLAQGSRPATGEIGANGRFTLTTFEKGDGCVPGKHRVTVIANKSLSENKVQWFAPKKYALSTTSELELEVTGSHEDVVLTLTWEGSGHDKSFTEIVN
jgi:hypothetical protein